MTAFFAAIDAFPIPLWVDISLIGASIVAIVFMLSTSRPRGSR